MNLTSLYKPRLTKNNLLKYVAFVTDLIAQRLTGKISKEKFGEKFEEATNKLVSKYGE